MLSFLSHFEALIYRVMFLGFSLLMGFQNFLPQLLFPFTRKDVTIHETFLGFSFSFYSLKGVFMQPGHC